MNNWVKVEDELPEVFKEVLCWAINKDPTSTFDIGEKYFCLDQFTDWSDEFPSCFRTDRYFGEVTHWMKLPEPPEENEPTTPNPS